MPKKRPRRRKGRSVSSRTAAALAGGALVMFPALAASGVPMPVTLIPTTNTGALLPNQAAPLQQPNIVMPPIAVDGSLPQPPIPEPLITPGGHAGSAGVSGPLGIPASMLKAYKNAAEILAKEQPGCHLDWALIASIGRIESNHARGGYVDAKGDTLELILGPVLNGAGAFAAIQDTDGGKYDSDAVWDRAVGPTQFIPSTWRGYASDGNGDGVSNPNNIYDETLATARYLCSGGLDLSTTDGQRIAVRRYNNSTSYVDTVMAWAEAYRAGVSQLPDSQIPIGTSSPPDNAAAAGPVTPPAVPPVTPVPPYPTLPGTTTPVTTTRGTTTTTKSSSTTTTSSSAPTSTPTTPTPTTPTSTAAANSTETSTTTTTTPSG